MLCNYNFAITLKACWKFCLSNWKKRRYILKKKNNWDYIINCGICKTRLQLRLDARTKRHIKYFDQCKNICHCTGKFFISVKFSLPQTKFLSSNPPNFKNILLWRNGHILGTVFDSWQTVKLLPGIYQKIASKLLNS